MTQYRLLRGGKIDGYIDITNKGFRIIGDGDLAEKLDKIASDFVRTGFNKTGEDVDYSCMCKTPTETMLEMLVRLESELDFLGYELAIY